MSIKIMTAVFDRYPNGGGEMLLALALADHSSDDGSRIYPSIKHLATKTRQSERSVQYQLRRMESEGWLILVNFGNGGRNQHRQYQISPDWLKGAEIAPRKKGATDDTKGATDDAKGCNPQQQRVQPIAPAYNHHGIITKPSEEEESFPPPSMTGAICMVMKACGMQGVNPGHADLQVLIDKGADIGMFVEVAKQCVKNGKPFNYALSVIKGQMRDAAALAETALAVPTAPARRTPPTDNFTAASYGKGGKL